MKNLYLVVLMCCMTVSLSACGDEKPIEKPSEKVATIPEESAAKPIELPAEELTAQLEKTESETAPAVEAEAPGEVGDAEIVEREGLCITEIVLGNGVEKIDGKKAPLNPGKVFRLADTEKVIAFMNVSNPESQETELVVSFKVPDSDEERGKVSVNIPAQPKWATRAFYKVKGPKGIWTVIVRHEDQIIAKAPFELTE